MDFETKINRAIVASFHVDAQRGFTPMCPTELPVMDGDKIVPDLLDQDKFAFYRIASKDWHHPYALHIATNTEPQFSPVGLPNVDIKWNRHCVAGTNGAELLEGLPHWSEYDYFIWKGLEKDCHVYSAIYHDLGKTRSTGVIEWMKSKNISVVIVGGLATDFCVKNTVLDLRDAGFSVMLNLSACRAIATVMSDGRNSLDVAMEEMFQAGVQFIDETKLLAEFIA